MSRSVFRVTPGPHRPGDVEAGRRVGRTSARFLANFSSARARRGDLLFLLRPGLGACHRMVYLGGGRAVYHTQRLSALASPPRGEGAQALGLTGLEGVSGANLGAPAHRPA